MKKVRRDTGDDEGGLDSLLDTMTNVVGILVLVLIVTQLSVADVVSQITQSIQVDPEELVQLDKQLQEKREEQEELKDMLEVDPLSIDVERQKEELDKKKVLLDRRRRLLEEKKKVQNEFSMKLEQDRKRADSNRKKVAETKEKREELTKLITTSLARKAELESMLDQTPNVEAPPDVEITIPNPRPAPQGAKAVVFVCTENELFPMNVDAFRKNAEAKAKAIIARFRLDRSPKAGIDPEQFKKYYERLEDQDDFFDVEYFVQQDRFPRIRLIPRSGRGASESELLNPRSRIRSRWLSTVDVNSYYARFFVLPDSYDVYVTARRFFTDAGMLGGWDPQSQDWTYTTSIPGGIVLGPPLKQEATPRPKPKPANVID